MLAMSTRVKPWTPRAVRLSSRRVTLTALPSTFTSASGLIATASLPRGPDTRTVPGSTATVTPDGTAIASLPIRDMIRSPHRAEQLAADAALLGVAVDENARGRREHVHPEAGAERRDHRPALLVVLEADTQLLPHPFADDRVIAEKSLGDEHAHDGFLRPRP